MALHRGIQSAIFYYLSCAPCTGYSYRKKRRKEAIRDRAQKHQLEMEEPGLYRHPSPFATNPNWQTEIDLGPSPLPPRGKKTSQKKGRVNTGNESNVTSSTSLPLAKGASNDSNYTLRKHQREDEELWRTSTSRTSPLGASVMDIGRPPTARTTRTDKTSTSYYSVQNAPINDLHPAIVTRIDNREDAMWMLQPPPSARVMSGREKPVTRVARSNSGSSKVSSRRPDSSPLSRQISHRIIDEKLRSRELLPAMDIDGERTPRPVDSALSPDTPTTERLSSDSTITSRRKRRPPPISVSEDTQNSNRSCTDRHKTHSHSAEALDTNGQSDPHYSEDPAVRNTRHLTASSKPSRDNARQRRTVAVKPDETARSTTRPTLGSKDRQDSSLNVLQELVPASMFNMRNSTKSPSFEAKIELPSPNSDETELLGSGKAAFENWFESRDIALFPEWVSERTKRDVSARWSVDF
ncbi:hypothetical protein AAFC00_005595 [Neodothiora populina]|uniref:Uncharacterized protein n=1 Tax=Neodothiora populina TaxID=2781224 RepID=A0ABR3PLD8_9PEZI